MCKLSEKLSKLFREEDIHSFITGISGGAYITIVTSMATIIGGSIYKLCTGEDVFSDLRTEYNTYTTLILGGVFLVLTLGLLRKRGKSPKEASKPVGNKAAKSAPQKEKKSPKRSK